MITSLFATAYSAESIDADSADDSGWIYRILPTGDCEIVGYEDRNISKLTIPKSIDGHIVTALSENAFENNIALTDIFIPSSVIFIPDTAFSVQKNLVIRSANGTCATAFSANAGFINLCTSEYDLWPDIIDLSEMDAAFFTLTQNTVQIQFPYSTLIKPGAKLLLPESYCYPNGLPVEIQAVSSLTEAASASYRVLDFTETLESYTVSNVNATADVNGIVILADGFSYENPALQPKGAVSFGKELTFNVDFELAKGRNVSGSISFTPSYTFDIDYRNFSIKELSYTNKTTSSFNLKFTDSTDLYENKPSAESVTFAKVPLSTPTLLSVWLELSLVVSVEGEVAIETSIVTTERFTWSPSSSATTSKTKSIEDFAADAAIGVKGELKCAIVVNLGFAGTGFNVDVAEMSVSLGVEVKVKFLSSESDCKDIDADATFQVKIKVGLLNTKWPNVALDITLFSLKWDIWDKHVEFNPFRILDICTKDMVSVTLSAGAPYAPDHLRIKKGTVITQLTAPYRSGYTFTGWYTDQDFSTLWDFNSQVQESMTLYAGWVLSQSEPTPTPMPVVTPSPAPIPDIEAQSAAASLEYLKYKLTDDAECIITGYTGKPETLTIPAYIDGCPVTTISSSAFYGLSSLTCVVFPSTLTTIENRAFMSCTSLQSIKLPYGLEYLGSQAFQHCEGLVEVTIPGSVEEMGFSIFADIDSLQTLYVSNGVTALGAGTCDSCKSLYRVYLPSTVESIGNNCFYNCDQLVEIDLPEGLKSIGTEAFWDCDALVRVSFPFSLESIESSAFQHCNALHTVQLQGALTKLGTYVFSNCSQLISVSISSDLSEIPTHTFYNCRNLISVELPDSVVEIASSAFESCIALSSVRMPQSISSIGDRAFAECSILEEIDLPEGLLSIGASAFDRCSRLIDIRFPFTLSSIGNYAFNRCSSLRTVELHGAMTDLGSYAFSYCDTLKSVTFNGAPSVIKAYTFTNCKLLDEVHLPDTLYEIGEGAFYNCDSLTEILLPEGLCIIKSNAFAYCSELKSVDFPFSLTEIGSTAFTENAKLESIEIHGRLSEMGTYVFSKCTSLQTVSITAEGLEILPGYTFNTCTSLTKVQLPSAMTKIEAYAFNGCTVLTEISLPKSLLSIGNGAFYNCKALSGLTLPDELTNIGQLAFWKNESLTEIVLPSSVTSVGSQCFSGCTSITNLFIPGNLQELGYGAFGGCTSLTSVTIQRGVTALPANCFSNCSSLSEVMLPETLTTLSSSAFYKCAALSTITLPSSITSIGSLAFSGCLSLSVAYVYSMDSFASVHFSSAYPAVHVALVSDRVTVQFDTCGGSYVPGVYSARGALIKVPEDPIKDNFTFRGWYEDPLYESLWDFESDTVPAGGLILYAGWVYEPEGFAYEETAGGLIIREYTGDDTYIAIPSYAAGKSVIAIDKNAFSGGITEIFIPASIEFIDPSAFRWAADLTSITVDSENMHYFSANGVLYTKDHALMHYPRAKYSLSFTPEEGTLSILERAIYNADYLHALVIPETVEVLEECSIYGLYALARVTFKAAPSAIAQGNFMNCSKNLLITGPVGATILENYADGYYLSYNLYNAVFQENETLLGAISVRAGALLGMPPVSEESDRSFIGWANVNEGNRLWNFESDRMPENDLILNAVWQYDFSTSSVSNSDGEHIGVQLDAYTGNRSEIRVPETINADSVVSIADDCFPDSGVVLTGNKGSITEEFAISHDMRFIPLTYTVTFHTNGGVPIDSITLSKTDCVPEPNAIKNGFTLVGWYTESVFARKWNFATHRMPADDLHLYARWQKTNALKDEIPFTFEPVPGGLTITGYIGNDGKASIPETINGMSVIAIAPYAFKDNDSLFEIIIPATVKTIGAGAFEGSALSTVTMHPGVTVIEAGAFQDCVYLSHIDLTDTITEIGAYALSGLASLTEITLPNGVETLSEGVLSSNSRLIRVSLPSTLTKICPHAFSGCTLLPQINFGERVSDIAPGAFVGCSSLSSVLVSDDNERYISVDGVLYSKDGTAMVLYPEGRIVSNYTVPDGVTDVLESAMARSSIEELHFPDSLQCLGVNALRMNLKLTKVYVPQDAFLMENSIPINNRVTIIGTYRSDAWRYASENGIRFLDCDRDVPVVEIRTANQVSLSVGSEAVLTSLLLPVNTTETTVVWSSSDASVASVNENGVIRAKKIGNVVITATARNGSTSLCLVSVVSNKNLPVSVTFAKDTVFASSGTQLTLSTVILPENADQSLYFESDNTVVALCEGNKIVCSAEGDAVITARTINGLTAYCVVRVKELIDTIDFILPSGLKYIESEAFMELPMTCVKCPDGLISIGARAFSMCHSLQAIIIPESVTFIDPTAFEGVTEITIYAPEDSVAHEYALSHNMNYLPY